MERSASQEEMWAREAAKLVWRRLVSVEWSGNDPYDGCLSARVPEAVLRSRGGRRLVTQAVKRLPLHEMLKVPPGIDAYTLGHALLAAARLRDDPGVPDAAGVAGEAVAQLRRMASADGGNGAWGYHFPVHTRFFSYVPPTPNLIVTAFVMKGMAAVTRAGVEDCRDDLRGAVRFILTGLPRVSGWGGECIGYVPGQSAAVHNANLLAASVLCEAGELCAEDAWTEQALSCARFSVARQAGDGSWPYSEERYGRWVDGFHTGFVLEGLARVARATGDEACRRALERGASFYVAQLFGPNGEPKYFPQRPRPYDALSAAQGVETLMVSLGGAAATAVPGQLTWIREHLVHPNGRVAYQVHYGWVDRREFPRWSSAPMLSALAGVPRLGGAT